MSISLATMAFLDGRQPVGPMHRSIVAVDLEGSTTRTNPVKGVLRRTMYELLGRALESAAITGNHLEELTDRGDGVLVLIRPHDDVPKTVLLSRLVPHMTTLLSTYNAGVKQPELRIRLRMVVHAGEVHADANGFYGEAIDVAIRLLDAAPVKKALKQATSPLVLVVSDEIHSGIVAQGYLDGGVYRQLVRLRVANRQHRGWVHIPGSGEPVATIGPGPLIRAAQSPFSVARSRARASGLQGEDDRRAWRAAAQ
jgi:class 3 adenylate cyclase